MTVYANGKFVEVIDAGGTIVSDIVKINTLGQWELLYTNNMPVSVPMKIRGTQVQQQSGNSTYTATDYFVWCNAQYWIRQTVRGGASSYMGMSFSFIDNRNNNTLSNGTYFQTGAEAHAPLSYNIWHTTCCRRGDAINAYQNGGTPQMLFWKIEGDQTLRNMYANTQLLCVDDRATPLTWYGSPTSDTELKLIVTTNNSLDRLHLLKIKHYAEHYEQAVAAMFYLTTSFYANNPYWVYPLWYFDNNMSASYILTDANINPNYSFLRDCKWPIFASANSNVASSDWIDLYADLRTSRAWALDTGASSNGGAMASANFWIRCGESVTAGKSADRSSNQLYPKCFVRILA